jgi:hypothetical protein
MWWIASSSACVCVNLLFACFFVQKFLSSYFSFIFGCLPIYLWHENGKKIGKNWLSLVDCYNLIYSFFVAKSFYLLFSYFLFTLSCLFVCVRGRMTAIVWNSLTKIVNNHRYLPWNGSDWLNLIYSTWELNCKLCLYSEYIF